jgi:hypothetical protein
MGIVRLRLSPIPYAFVNAELAIAEASSVYLGDKTGFASKRRYRFDIIDIGLATVTATPRLLIYTCVADNLATMARGLVDESTTVTLARVGGTIGGVAFAIYIGKLAYERTKGRAATLHS